MPEADGYHAQVMHRMASVRAAPVTKEVTLIRVMLVIFGNDDAVRRDDVNVC